MKARGNYGATTPTGQVTMRKVSGTKKFVTVFRNALQQGLPNRYLPHFVNEWRKDNMGNLWRGLWRVGIAEAAGIATPVGGLYLTVIPKGEQPVYMGLASLRVVTDVGVAYIVDAFQNSVELEDMKYHGIGTGGTAEAAGDTDLVTELTTEYQTNNTRATGTTTEGATANIYRSVGTNTVDAGVAITEHGLFNNATVGSGVLLDRSLFTVINLSSGDSLQSTYDLTLTAGS